MPRPSLLQITVVLLLAVAGLMAVSAAQRSRSKQEGPSQAEVRPAAPQVDPSLIAPKLTPDAPHQLAPQNLPPAPAAVKPGLSYAVAGVKRRHSIALRASPGGRVAARVGAFTDYGSRTMLSVAARRKQWLGLTSSKIPNGKLGWVRAGNPALDMYETTASVRIDLSRRTLELRNGREVVRRATVAVGRLGSSTPTGRFSVTDELKGSSYGSYYGCCILALSGHQPNPPAGWQGGTRLAIHGTDDPGSIGMRSSAGCLRADAQDMRALMRRVPLGTPVFISA